MAEGIFDEAKNLIAAIKSLKLKTKADTSKDFQIWFQFIYSCKGHQTRKYRTRYINENQTI